MSAQPSAHSSALLIRVTGHDRPGVTHALTSILARYGVRAGFETHNLGHLLRALREWNVAPDLVVGPLNPRGFMMKPDPESTLRELGACRFPVVGKELTAGGSVPLASGMVMARSAASATASESARVPVPWQVTITVKLKAPSCVGVPTMRLPWIVSPGGRPPVVIPQTGSEPERQSASSGCW